jgi:hypothetical protein
MKSFANYETELYMSYKNINWNLKAVVNYDSDNQLSNIASECNIISPKCMTIKKNYID